MDFQTPIKDLNRVGDSTALKLARLNINTAGDLLWYLPFRYDDYSQQVKIADVLLGAKVNLVGEIQLLNNKKTPRARMNITEALVGDETAMIRVLWFNQPYIAKTLAVGDRISLAGKVEEDFAGVLMKSPNFEKLSTQQSIHTQGLVPIYGLTAELTAKQMRFLMSQVIQLADNCAEFLPDKLRQQYQLIGISQALRQIHFPKSQAEANEAKRRLSFDELLYLQFQAQILRRQAIRDRSPQIAFDETATKALVASLPFTLTDDQRRSAWEIIQSLASDKPMIRLLEGDVGTGKTVVALLAMLNVARSGAQSAIMAPTEILASQHFISIAKLASGTSLRIALLSRTMHQVTGVDVKISKAKLIKLIADGEIDLVIGTHALIQEAVTFKNLALVVVDEQHRFGVEQRQALVSKSSNGLVPHLLSMTATPIPRSLALALYDDLDISIIKSKPKDRAPIITKIISEADRFQTYEFIRAQILSGYQAFIICPLIDPSDALGVRSVTEEYERLSNSVFQQFSVGLLHGKLKPKLKDELMKDFADNKINILVATSVIEVGIDVPNATIMMIENADRFGLAQLHQYRGRVGRGLAQSYCLLFTDHDDSKSSQRLNALLKFDNGFDLAKEDLTFRGPGEVYGKLQSGFPELKIASLFDFELMKQAKSAVSEILSTDPDLQSHPLIREKLGQLAKAHFE